MDCEEVCPQDAIEFSFIPSTKSARVSNRELQVTRRGLLTALASSMIALPFLRTTAYTKSNRTGLLRPPGAVDEARGSEEEPNFLARCIRCGECMRACPQHALQPALLQFGLEKMWSPVLSPRIGYCAYNCTLCMQVCPTGALELLSQRAKQNYRMGTAFFDKDRCIPWAENNDCLVCEEVCPTTPVKAIQLREEEVLDDAGNKRIVKRPFIVDAYCIGCGICETKCPVQGLSAVRVAARYETRFGGLPDEAASGMAPVKPSKRKSSGQPGGTAPGPYGSSPRSNPYGSAPKSNPYGK
jgi:ferredoxin